MPNRRLVLLEQCALLKIDYKNLDENAHYDPAWEDVPIINKMSGDERRKLLFQMFEYFRKAYALYSENYLIENAIRSKRLQINEKLKQPWKFGLTEKITETEKRLGDQISSLDTFVKWAVSILILVVLTVIALPQIFGYLRDKKEREKLEERVERLKF